MLIDMNRGKPSRRFWRTCTQAALNVAQWPAWMRRDEAVDPISQALKIEELREELAALDEADMLYSLPCGKTETYQPPRHPECYDGIGCDECWDKLDRWLEANPCDF